MTGWKAHPPFQGYHGFKGCTITVFLLLLILMTPATQFLTDQEGHKTAVVLPLIEYEALLEDLHDLAIIAERRDEPRTSIQEVKDRLKADGFLQD